jgi:hypothetical protein
MLSYPPPLPASILEWSSSRESIVIIYSLSLPLPPAFAKERREFIKFYTQRFPSFVGFIAIEMNIIIFIE